MKKLLITLTLLFTLTFSYGQDCYYTVILYDSYGDGWYAGDGSINGYIDVLINGVIIYDDEYVASGYGIIYTLVVSDGDIITITYESLHGNQWWWTNYGIPNYGYEFENYWWMDDCDGNEVLFENSDDTDQTIDITVDCDCVPLQGDCGLAETICDEEDINNNATGSGAYAELNTTNHGCLLSNENYSNWIYFHAETSGTVELTITPNNENGGDDDYDFGIWETATCPPVTEPIRCSWSQLTGETGLETGTPEGDTSEDDLGDSWVESIDVLAGEEFTMVINNYTGNDNSFTLTWTLTNGATLDCTDILPVEMAYLSAGCNFDNVVIQWKTLSETNNDYFEIQKTYTLGYPWQLVITLDGNGNSTQTIQYSYEYFEQHIDDVYYRIKQVDFDGQIEYSDIITVNCDQIIYTDIEVYPNPADSGEEIHIEGVYSSYIVYDIMGRVCDIRKLKKGAYILLIDGSYSVKIIVR